MLIFGLILIGAVAMTCSNVRGVDTVITYPENKYEYAVVKWDGPDRLFYNLPGKFKMVHIEKQGVVIPKDAREEEFCLAYAANKMAKDGWEAVNLDSRRILFRRRVN